MKTKLQVFKPSFLALALIVFQTTLSPAQISQREQENAWTKVIGIAESLIGEGGVIDAQGAEGKIDALVDLHVQFCQDVLGKPVPSQRVMLVKQGFRLFLKTAPERYGGDKRQATLRLLRDLAANRAVFVDLFSSDSPAESVEQQLLAYLERNQSLTYKEPVPIAGQIKTPSSTTELRIVADAIRLVGDQGTSGHYNRAIDAGEIITLNIPLKNVASHPFRSTSAILETGDAYVRANVSKVVYTERSTVGGETITFAPGAAITPKQNFSFTVSPNCPDNHEVVFNLHVGDSDYGEFKIPFSITVYHVGPLDFGEVKIDDDRFGDSDGNKNGVMEAGETIEYVLPLRNLGVVEISDAVATLFTAEPRVKFKQGYEESRYKVVPGKSERPIPASYVFSLTGNADDYVDRLVLRLLTKGTARGFAYSWLRTQMHQVGLSKVRNVEIIVRAAIQKEANSLRGLFLPAEILEGFIDEAVSAGKVSSKEKALTGLESDRIKMADECVGLFAGLEQSKVAYEDLGTDGLSENEKTEIKRSKAKMQVADVGVKHDGKKVAVFRVAYWKDEWRVISFTATTW